LTPLPTDLVHPSRQQTVFVAGGSGIIGQAICRYFGDRQWHVGIHYYRNHESANNTAQHIHDVGGTAELYQANIQDYSQCEAMLQTFHEQSHQCNVLIWAIGVSESQLLARTTPESWTTHITTNLTGCFQFLKASGAIFERQHHGSVILIGSLSGILGTVGQAAYAASKSGLIGLMKSVAKEWAPWHIRVNAIFPGWHASPLSKAAYSPEKNFDNHLLKNTPATTDVAKAVFELALMESMSGQIWNLDSRIW